MSSSPSRSPKPDGSDDVELARLYNCSATALNILYEAAVGGSHAAREDLHQVADTLIQAAGKHGDDLRTGNLESGRTLGRRGPGHKE
jgi:hypothetical protein